MTSLLVALALLGPIDYERIDKIPYGQSVATENDQRRYPVADATTLRILREPEGIHLLVVRDKCHPKPHTEWLPWIDSQGHPWLLKSIDGWYIRLWQATEWRAWKFASDDAWATYWRTTPTRPTVQGQVNFGVNEGWAGSGSTSSTDTLTTCPTHGQGPCPSPGPCPRPGPDDRPFFPDLNPKVTVKLDPTIVAIVAGLIGFLALTMLGLIAALLLRRRAA